MGVAATRSRGTDLRLPGTQLSFSSQQLLRLNSLLQQLPASDADMGEEFSSTDDCLSPAVVVLVERLVQRLVAGAGTLDPRFASKFLASLDSPTQRGQKAGPRFQYVVRLDALSSPPLYPGDDSAPCKLDTGDGIPQGFARISFTSSSTRDWAEFVSSTGYLRRDRVQERFVELLARAACKASPPLRPDEVDESVLCGCPGKLVDVGVLQRLLAIPPHHQLYYGAEDCSQSRFPDPRDFRIAIVEGAPEVRLRIGFLSLPQEDVEVRLVLAVGFQGWPPDSDFPARVPLGHFDSLLYQQAAQTGVLAVPAAPHHAVRCEDRTTAWQVWLPAAELVLTSHYGASSVPGQVLAILESAVRQLKARLPHMSLTVVSRYMLRTLLWFSLEREEDWSPETLSAHVLRLLDALVTALRSQRHRSYFFPRCNVMLHAASSGRNHAEEDYLADAEVLDTFIRHLHQESLPQTFQPEADDLRHLDERKCRARLEEALSSRWEDVVRSLGPQATRRHYFSASQFSRRQLEYIGLLLREVLRVRQLVAPNLKKGSCPGGPEDPVEDLVFLLRTTADQARLQTPSCSRLRHDDLEASVAALCDCARRGAHAACDDVDLVRQLLHWLYRASEPLRGVVRPYLASLFVASHFNCWHLPQWRRQRCELEAKTLGVFCAGLLRPRPHDALATLRDAASKRWRWAEDMLRLAADLSGGVTRGLVLVLTPHRGKVQRTILELPDKGVSLQRRRPSQEELVCCLLPPTEQPPGATPPHCRLRDSSAFTLMAEAGRRYGVQRGVGDIVPALISMRKFSVLQDVSRLLPEDKRQHVLDLIHKMARESARKIRHQASVDSDLPPTARYRLRRDSLPASMDKDTLTTPRYLTGAETLLGTCRAARRQTQAPQPFIALTPDRRIVLDPKPPKIQDQQRSSHPATYK